MADGDKTQSEKNAEKLAKMTKAEELEAAAKEESARLKAQGVVIGPAAPAERGISLMSHRLVRLEEAHNAYDVPVEYGSAEQALTTPGLLWPHNEKLRRFDTVLLHDELYSWEVLARVMRIDKELQVVLVSPIGPVYSHDVSSAPIDYDSIKIVHRGVKAKWSAVYKGKTVLKDGFETEGEALKWLTRKKVA
jgi:hypothetical protein